MYNQTKLKADLMWYYVTAQLQQVYKYIEMSIVMVVMHTFHASVVASTNIFVMMTRFVTSKKNVKRLYVIWNKPKVAKITTRGLTQLTTDYIVVYFNSTTL